MYHCGLHWYPWTRFDVKSICFGLYMSTHGAWSVTSWSTSAQSWLAASGSVTPVSRALSILAWMPLSQNSAMLGLALLFGWIEPHPRSTFRKSDGAG